MSSIHVTLYHKTFTMKTLQKHMLSSLLLKAATLCIASVLLFFISLAVAGKEVAFQQAPYLVLVSTLFFALSLGGGALFTVVMKDGGKRAISFYLLAKVLRLFLSIAVLLIYALADCRNILAFSMNLLVLYLVSMVTSIIYYVRVEQKLSKK